MPSLQRRRVLHGRHQQAEETRHGVVIEDDVFGQSQVVVEETLAVLADGHFQVGGHKGRVMPRADVPDGLVTEQVALVQPVVLDTGAVGDVERCGGALHLTGQSKIRRVYLHVCLLLLQYI